MSPLLFLAILVFVTAAARLAYAISVRARRREMQQLARQWEMHYSPRDRFDLAGGVAQRFPIPGAAEVRILDLLYASEGDHYRYLFSVEYTLGVTHGKHRLRRVATFREPKARSESAEWSALFLAPEELPLIEQYKHLHQTIVVPSGAAPVVAAA
jgi:hypothetical protein